MIRPVQLVLLLLMVVLIAAMEEPLGPNRAVAEPFLSANDLDADASSWGYSRPWRYGGWRGGWGGWRGGWGWGGRTWVGRGGWW